VNGFDFAVVASLACSGAFMVLAAVIAIVNRPQSPPDLPAMSDLGPETPAVANLLANGGRVTPDAVPATLFDLAARKTVKIEEDEPGSYICRIGLETSGALTSYETRVLDLLRRRAKGGVVPAQALTAGPTDEAKGWMKAFQRSVVSEARAAGKCGPRWPRRAIAVLGGLGLGALTFAAAGGNEDSVTGPQAVAIGCAILVLVILVKVFSADAQMVTPAGLDSQARWLSLRKFLREDEIFSTLPPTAVAVRERYLAYGAALGVAAAAVRAIPMGAESDRWAWTQYGGGWRQVRVSYPRVWPPAWGYSPRAVGWTGIQVGAFGAVVLWVSSLMLPSIELGPQADQVARWVSVGILLATVIGLVAASLGIVVLCTAIVAALRTTQVTGEAIRVRRFGGDEEARCYLAVYTGTGDRVRAWMVRPELYPALREYSTVTVSVGALIGYVRSVHATTRSGQQLVSSKA
jgi:predicted membrane protein DUF2207